MRCHFNMRRGFRRIVDEAGVEAIDLVSARRDARMAINEMFLAHKDAATLWDGWTMEVTDENGAVLFILDMKPPSTDTR